MERSDLISFVSELLKALHVDVSSIDIRGSERIIVAVETPQSRELIGPKGEHLRALNYIAKRMMETKAPGDAPNFIIDVGDYLEKQLDTVRANAQMLAQRVRLFKHDVELAPMTAYERLVIHELFANDTEIKTESQGEGKFRHVVLKFASAGEKEVAHELKS